MEVKWLKTFLVAAKYENFRKASEELFLTQPAVTKHIQRLEQYVHIDLFHRVGKQVTLTAAGYKFQSTAEKILAAYEQEMEQFESWLQGYQQKVTIAVAPQIASSILPSFLRLFIDDHQDIEVNIRVVNSYEIGETVRIGKADIGLTRMVPVQAEIQCTMVHQDPVIMIAPYSSEEMNEKELLKKYRLLVDNHPTYWNALLSEIKHSYPYVRTLPVTQMEITKRFIEQKLGVSYIPSSMVQDEIKNKTLMEIKDTQLQLPFSNTYIVNKVKTPEVQVFVNALQGWFQSNI